MKLFRGARENCSQRVLGLTLDIKPSPMREWLSVMVFEFTLFKEQYWVTIHYGQVPVEERRE